MPFYTKNAGTWKNVNKFFVKNGGTWRTISKAWVKSGGIWRQFYNSTPPAPIPPDPSILPSFTPSIYPGNFSYLHLVTNGIDQVLLFRGDGTTNTYFYTSNGTTWNTGTLPISPNNINTVDYDPVNNHYLISVNNTATLLRSSDGINWTSLTAPQNNINVSAIRCGNGVWLANYYSAPYLYRSTNGGVSWSSLNQNVYDIWYNSEANIWGSWVSPDYKPGYSTNNGTSWTISNFNLPNGGEDMASIKGRFYIYPTAGLMSVSSDGINYTSVNSSNLPAGKVFAPYSLKFDSYGQQRYGAIIVNGTSPYNNPQFTWSINGNIWYTTTNSTLNTYNTNFFLTYCESIGFLLIADAGKTMIMKFPS